MPEPLPMPRPDAVPAASAGVAPASVPPGSTLRNLLAVTVPELLWGFASALTIESAMPASFRGYLCADESFLGTWTLVTSLAGAVAMLLTAWWVQPLVRRRAFVVWGHVITGALYLPVILLARALGDGETASATGALLGMGLFAFSMGFLMPAWLALIGALFPEGQRSRVLGLVFVVNRAGGIAGGLVAESVLRSALEPDAQWLWLWGLAAGVGVLGGVPFLWIREVDGAARPRQPLGAYLGGLVHAARGQAALVRFLLVDLLVVAGWVVLAHYGDMAFDVRGLDPQAAGRFTAAAAAAQLAGALVVAAAGSRLAPRVGLAGGGVCIALAGVLACTGQGEGAFLAVAALTGAYLSTRQTCHGPQLMRVAGAHDPTPALSLGMAVASLAAALLPFAAGLLRPVTGFPVLFATVSACALLGALLLVLRPRVAGR